LKRFATDRRGYEPAALDRAVSELLEQIRPGTLIRFDVGSLLPNAGYPPPLGPEHLVEIVAEEPYVLATWTELIGGAGSTGGGDPDGPWAA
jgi:hypothetical protein